MICPKCKTENSQDAIFCAHCGYKLKVVCPKCKMTNNLKAQRCSNCGLRLIRPCPVCQTPNSPLSEKCKKCLTPLLRKCKSCGALNSLKTTHCKKCSSPLDDKPEDYKPHSTILIELANAQVLNETIPKKELVEKLIKKFFQTILSSFNSYGLKALKLASYTIGAEFEDIDDQKAASMAEELLAEFVALNEKLSNVNISYDVKILVSQALSRKHKFGADMLSQTPIGVLCLDAASAIALKDSYNLEKAAPGLYIASKSIIAAVTNTPPPVEPIQPEIEPEIAVSKEIPIEEDTEILEEIPVQEVETLEQPAEKVVLESLEDSALDISQTSIPPTPKVEIPSQEQDIAAPVQETPVETGKENERNLIAEKIKNLLEAKKGGFISISGESGIGKKTVFNFAMSQMQGHNFCLLQADCHLGLNTVSFPTLQILIRSMFSLPIINFEAEKMQNIVKNALMNSLQINDEKVINPILNLIVPKASNKTIEESKEELIFAVKELFNAVKKLQKIILIIKEIEFMDKSSAEIFDRLIDEGFLEDAFFITTTSENSHISAFMQSPKLAKYNLGTFKILPLTPDETIEELGYYIINPEEISSEILEQIKIKTKGSPLFLEEIVVFLSQAGLVTATETGIKVKPEIKELVFPDRIEELIAVRLESLFAQNEVIYQMILNAVCLGYTFFPPVIQRVLGLDDNTFGVLINVLMTTGFLITHDNVNFKFKNKFIFEIIKQFVIKNEEQEKQINANILSVMIDMNESNSSQTAEIAQKAQNFEQAFVLWTMAGQEATSTGDRALFTKTQKEALATIDYSNYPDKEARKIKMQEHLGIAHYMSEPEDSLSFLSQVIQHYENENNREKILEITPYFVKTLDILGNPQEAVEYIDKAIEYINPEKMPIEIALLKYLKLKFLINSGYLGEVITLIQSDIMPSLQSGVKVQKDFTERENKIINEAILKTQLKLLKALSLQGNKNYYNVLELFITNNQDEKAKIEVFVIDAWHKILNGMPEEAMTSITKTENILKGFDFKGHELEKENYLLELNAAKILSKVLYEDNYNVSQDVAAIAQKSRMVNNSFVYNLIQILFVNQLTENKDYTQAATMTDECLNYFASQKIALFAIPGWAILSKIQAAMEEYGQAISIAQQALDVASKPQIQNNYYIVFMKKLLGEYFAAQNDFEMAKMHLEEAIDFAKTNDLLFMQGRLYLDLAKIHIENPQESNDTAIKIIDASQEIATSIESEFLKKKIEQLKAQIH